MSLAILLPARPAQSMLAEPILSSEDRIVPRLRPSL